MGISQKGFTAIPVMIIVIVLLVIGGTGYAVYRVHAHHVTQSGAIDVKELGFKLTFPDANHWNYQISSSALGNGVTFSYVGWGGVGDITRYTGPPSPNDHSGYRRFDKQIGKFYISLSKLGCPCTSQGDQYFAQLNTAFNTAMAD